MPCIKRPLIAIFTVLALTLPVSDVRADQQTWRIVRASDGTLYAVLGAARVTLSPDPISDDELASLVDMGSMTQLPVVLALATPTPAPPISAPSVIAATPTPNNGPSLRLGSHGLLSMTGLDEYVAVVENTSQLFALEDCGYTVTAFDSSGRALASAKRLSPLLLPGQQMGLPTYLGIPSGVRPATFDVQLIQGNSVVSPNIPPLIAKQVRVSPGDQHAVPKVMGVIQNPRAADTGGLFVLAVGLDSQGTVVAASTSTLYVTNIPAGSELAVELDLLTRVAPWGNPYSNLDLYAIPESPPPSLR